MIEFANNHPELIQTLLAWTAALLGYNWARYCLRGRREWRWTHYMIATTIQLVIGGIAAYVLSDLSYFHLGGLHLGAQFEFGLKIFTVFTFATALGIFVKARELQGD